MALLGVIVPMYNVEKYIEQSIHSIQRQTFKNFICYIIDDGSTDNSKVIAEQTIGNDDRFVVISKKNEGVSKTRNKGIELSNEPFIMFVDPDDWLESEYFERMIKAAEENDVDTVICDYFCNTETTCVSKKAIQETSPQKYYDESFFNNVLKTEVGLTGQQMQHPEFSDRLTSVWAKLYRREIILNKNINFCDLKLVPSECQLFNIDYFCNAKSAFYIPMPLYHYRRSSSPSLTKKFRNDLLPAWDYYNKLLLNKLDAYFRYQEIYQAYIHGISFSVIQLGRNALMKPDFYSQLMEIKAILNTDFIHGALKRMEFSCLPLYWKMFFATAKYKCSLIFLVGTKALQYLASKRK